MKRPAILSWIWFPWIIVTLILVVKSASGDDVGWILRSADTGHEVVVLQLDQAPAGAVVELWSGSESIKLPAAEVVDWVKQQKRESAACAGKGRNPDTVPPVVRAAGK